MTQYAVLLFDQVTDLPPEVVRAREELPRRIAEHGGRVVGGLTLERPETATSLRGDQVTDGPFAETEVLDWIFVVEARDLEHALELARLTPVVAGGVEVRPLIGFAATATG